MPRTLNLGILAHVDAGKTTLTERLLYEAGVIAEVGSVDAGTTQTDSMELERRRGITIRSAVVSFPVGGVTVNVIDTPGHPDFIAEVERVLSVLDGAVLVLSAVEGVQPQTRVLMRALRRLRVPTLLFVNKIDRRGADPDRVLAAIARRLTGDIVPMGSVTEPGTPAARFAPGCVDDADFRMVLTEALARHDDALLAAYVEDERGVTGRRLRDELAAQTRRVTTHPVFFGSAASGAGVAALTAGLVELLPSSAGDADAPAAGTVFKVERGAAGEKIAYVRMFRGAVRARQRLRFGQGGDEKVTAVGVFDAGAWVRRDAVRAGEIGKIWGLGGVRVGDPIGQPRAATGVDGPQFAPPTLETVVAPRDPRDKAALRVALAQLAEQDPLIDVRQDDVRQEISVSLYGEVQKEVIQATLASDYGIEVTCRESTTICVERPARAGEAVEVMNSGENPFHATIGLRVEPGDGVDFRLAVDPSSVPLYIYKSVDNFAAMMGEYVREALAEGLFGWRVTGCVVTMIRCQYSSWDGPPSTRGPLSTAADFRRLTPIVVTRALEEAAAGVCEPILDVRLEVPQGTVGPVLASLGRLGAAVRGQDVRGDLGVVEAALPAARARDLQRRLPGLTGGEGVLESRFGGYRPVAGPPPTRPRTTPDPRNREEYLASLRR